MSDEAETTPEATEPHAFATFPIDPMVAITVLVTGTVIGRAKVAKNTSLRVLKSQADVLANLTPPRVRIDGV
jgi:hypothetical protein